MQEILEAVDMTANGFIKTLPKHHRNGMQTMLLGFQDFPNMPEMEKRIDKGGFLDYKLPLQDDNFLPVHFKEGALSGMIEQPIDSEDDAARGAVFSAMAELASYEALAEFAKERTKGTSQFDQMTARRLDAAVGVLRTKLAEKLESDWPASVGYFDSFCEQMRTHFVRQFERAAPAQTEEKIRS